MYRGVNTKPVSLKLWISNTMEPTENQRVNAMIEFTDLLISLMGIDKSSFTTNITSELPSK